MLTIGFQPATSYAAGNSPNGVAAGDFDGDGITHIAVASTENLFVFLNDGKGSFRDALATRPPARAPSRGPIRSRWATSTATATLTSWRRTRQATSPYCRGGATARSSRRS